MSIITKAGSPVKGSPTLFTLSKSALAAVTSVAASAYYSDSTNWKEVSLVYKSSTGNQSEIVKFDASLSSPTANFAVSLKARDIFQIHKIVIKDFDGGYFEVPRSALTTAEFDVDMSGSPAPTAYRYYKTAFYSGYNAFGNPSIQYTYVVLTNVQFKINGINTSPTSASFSTGNWAGSALDLIDNNFSTEAYCGSLQNGTRYAIFDMGSSVAASDILISPRTNSSDYPPKHFEVFGSNDGVSFESIGCYDASNLAGQWASSTYRSFALSATPVESPYAIQWDHYNGDTNRECNGGFSGVSPTWNAANAWSDANKITTSGDFSFVMNVMSYAGLQSLHGFKTSQPNVNDSGYDNHSYGFYRNGAGGLFVAIGASYEGFGLGPISDGAHELKIARESGNLNFYVDSVLKYTVNSYSASTIYPYASTYNGGMIITSSTMTPVVPIVSDINWNILGTNLTAQASGGLTNASLNAWGVNNTATSSLSQSSNSSDWTYTFNVLMGSYKEFSCGTGRSTTITSGPFDDIDYGFHVNMSTGIVDISLQGNYSAYPNVATVSSGLSEFKIVYTHADYTVKFYVDSVLVHTQTGGSGYFNTYPTSYPIFAFYNGTPQGLTLAYSSKIN